MTDGVARELWDRVGELFAEADGGIVDVGIVGLVPDDVAAVVRVLVDAAARVKAAPVVVAGDGDADADPTVVPLGDPTKLHRIAAAAHDVAVAARAPFHVVLSGVARGRVVLPDLGVFVFADEVTLDYAPGPAWTPDAVAALFALLASIRRVAAHASVRADGHLTAAWQERFAEAVERYADPAATA